MGTEITELFSKSPAILLHCQPQRFLIVYYKFGSIACRAMVFVIFFQQIRCFLNVMSVQKELEIVATVQCIKRLISTKYGTCFVQLIESCFKSFPVEVFLFCIVLFFVVEEGWKGDATTQAVLQVTAGLLISFHRSQSRRDNRVFNSR